MKGLARFNDPVIGGLHCHGHDHGLQPSPGSIVEGSTKVFVEDRPAVRDGDRGYSPVCCGGIGEIIVMATSGKVWIDGRPAAHAGSRTLHCGMAKGTIREGSRKVVIA